MEIKPVNFDAPLWVLVPKAFLGILLSALLMLALFWLRFGEIPVFAFGFVIFTSVLQILMIVGARLRDRTDLHTSKALHNDWLDKIGAWWLMACAFGALLGWACGVFAAEIPDYGIYFHLAKIFFTTFLPVFTMLPNLRYVEAKAAAIQIPLLIFVTSLPMLVGVSSVLPL